MTVASRVRDVKVKGNTVRPRELNINTSLDTDFAAAGVAGTGAEDLSSSAGNEVGVFRITGGADDGNDSKGESAKAEGSAGWRIHSRLRARGEHAEFESPSLEGHGSSQKQVPKPLYKSCPASPVNESGQGRMWRCPVGAPCSTRDKAGRRYLFVH